MTAVGPSTDPFAIAQRWDQYTELEHEIWSLLYQRRMETLRVTACRLFLAGMGTIGLRPDRVPKLSEVNHRLAPLTGWRAVPVKGFLPARQFFASLASRRFPTTVSVRSREQIDYLPEPDIFHDIFGHVPLHADPVFAACLERFGALAATAGTEAGVTRMTRLFWFTVEFGLIREAGEVRIFGSALEWHGPSRGSSMRERALPRGIFGLGDRRLHDHRCTGRESSNHDQ